MATITSNGTGGGDWDATATWVGVDLRREEEELLLAAYYMY